MVRMAVTTRQQVVALMIVMGGLATAAPSIAQTKQVCRPAASRCAAKCGDKGLKARLASMLHSTKHGPKTPGAKCAPKCSPSEAAKCSPPY